MTLDISDVTKPILDMMNYDTSITVEFIVLQKTDGKVYVLFSFGMSPVNTLNLTACHISTDLTSCFSILLTPMNTRTVELEL